MGQLLCIHNQDVVVKLKKKMSLEKATSWKLRVLVHKVAHEIACTHFTALDWLYLQTFLNNYSNLLPHLEPQWLKQSNEIFLQEMPHYLAIVSVSRFNLCAGKVTIGNYTGL